MAKAIFAGALGQVPTWRRTWVERCAVHLPWMLFAVVYYAFLMAWPGQGQTTLEYPVQRPLLAVFVVGRAVKSIAVETHFWPDASNPEFPPCGRAGSNGLVVRPDEDVSSWQAQ